ncbi:MAG: ferritin-like domain-containing protein [Acidobacteriota bacterium]
MASTPMSLHDLFLDELRDLYDAEKQLIKALPKMAKKATSRDLRVAIESHLEETRTHVDRLEQAFEMLEEKPRGKHCAGIAGIVEEASEVLSEDVDESALDAAIIAGGQRAEHYEMAAYGSVMAWAKALGHEEIATLLSDTLNEEKAADAKLTELAEGGINTDAADGRQDDGEDADAGGTPRAAAAGRPAGDRRAKSSARR